MDDLGATPYRLESMTFKTANLSCLSRINPSDNLDITGVKEIGRKCLLMSVACVFLGTGEIFAFSRLTVVFLAYKSNLRLMGYAKISANSL